jgi:hypothetical protein
MSDRRKTENAAAANEAVAAAGRPHARGSRAGDIEEGLIRYLAAEQYHRKAEETREEDDAAAQQPKPDSPR